GSLLSGHLYATVRVACHRPAAAGDHLSPALSYVRRGFAAAGPGPALSGWADWHARHLTDLDPRPALPPSRPLSGAGACLDARWQALVGREKRLSATRQAARSAVSGEIPRSLAPDSLGRPARRARLGQVVGR